MMQDTATVMLTRKPDDHDPHRRKRQRTVGNGAEEKKEADE
jgi:hypothetical protein